VSSNGAIQQPVEAAAMPGGLRRAIADGLQRHRSGQAVDPWRISGHSLQLTEGDDSPVLQCSIAFGQSFDDEVVRGILEYALIGIRHFDASVVIDHEAGHLTLCATLEELSADALWLACEQMVNHTDLWIEVVGQKLLPRVHRAGNSAARLARVPSRL
jgi:hypothetical protein